MNTNPSSIDVLFVSELGLWPPDRGFRVHGCHMARALSELGVHVAMTSLRPTDKKAPPWLREMLLDWPVATHEDAACFNNGWAGRFASMRRRLARHQAMDPGELAGVIPLVREHQPKVVIGLGQHAPLVLRGLREAFPRVKTIWYAADEPVSFHLSCLRRDPSALWGTRLRLVGLFLAIERLFARGLDGAIGVSPADTRALLWLAGAQNNVTIRNGVDLNAYRPRPEPTRPRSVAFWGRMDFEPNVDAVTWFVNEVWPTLTWRAPDARCLIVGKNPTNQVKRLRAMPGVVVTGQVDDIQPYAHSAELTVLPLRCGRGIKNKLLEAAAMGRPILASPQALRGLELPEDRTPMLACRSTEDWVESIWRLWHDPSARLKLGHEARDWARRRHAWPSAAARLVAFMNRMLPAHQRIEIAAPVEQREAPRIAATLPGPIRRKAA